MEQYSLLMNWEAQSNYVTQRVTIMTSLGSFSLTSSRGNPQIQPFKLTSLAVAPTPLSSKKTYKQAVENLVGQIKEAYFVVKTHIMWRSNDI